MSVRSSHDICRGLIVLTRAHFSVTAKCLWTDLQPQSLAFNHASIRYRELSMYLLHRASRPNIQMQPIDKLNTSNDGQYLHKPISIRRLDISDYI